MIVCGYRRVAEVELAIAALLVDVGVTGDHLARGRADAKYISTGYKMSVIAAGEANIKGNTRNGIKGTMLEKIAGRGGEGDVSICFVEAIKLRIKDGQVDQACKECRGLTLKPAPITRDAVRR